MLSVLNKSCDPLEIGSETVCEGLVVAYAANIPRALTHRREVFKYGVDLLVVGTFPGAYMRSDDLFCGCDVYGIYSRAGLFPAMLPIIDVPRVDLLAAPAEFVCGYDVERLPGCVDYTEAIFEKILCVIIVVFSGKHYGLLGDKVGIFLGKSLPDDGSLAARNDCARDLSNEFAIHLLDVLPVVFLHISFTFRAIVPRVEICLVAAYVDVFGLGEHIHDLIDKSKNRIYALRISRAEDPVGAYNVALIGAYLRAADVALDMKPEDLGICFDEPYCVSRNLDLGNNVDSVGICIRAEALDILKGIVRAISRNIREGAGRESIELIVHKVKMQIFYLHRKADIDISVYEARGLPLSRKVDHKRAVAFVRVILDIYAAYLDLSSLKGEDVKERSYGV